MSNKYSENYTDDGYVMNYKKGPKNNPYKNCILQFKIELPEILPAIWRKILVPSDYNFWDLHVAIQDSMGWLDYHLHYFEFNAQGKGKEERIGIPDFEKSGELPEIFPGWEIPVVKYFNVLGLSALYLYDLTDSWWHNVQLEGYLYREKKAKYPICVDGEGSCPPEDCGGASGYYEILKTLSNPKDKGYKDMKMWVGKNWNSERFDKYQIEFMDPKKRWKKAFLEK